MKDDSEESSLDLVRKIQAGEQVEENFLKLDRKNRKRVEDFFRRKGFSSEEVKDLTQDVFLRVLKGIHDFRGESTFEWWLLEVAKSAYKNELRRKGADKRDGIEQSLDDTNTDDSSRSVMEIASPDPDPVMALVRQERIDLVRAAVQEFPPQMRLCFQMRYVEGLQYREIAALMQISIETVKAHLHQARKRLIEKLGG